MARTGSNLFINNLRKLGELVEVDAYVDPNLEICEITDRISKQKDGGKSLLFTNNGTNFPVLINSLGSLKRIEIAFGGRNPDQLATMMEDIAKGMSQSSSGILNKISMLPKLKKMGSWLPGKKKGKGECQEVIMDQPDLAKLPVLTCWPHDGGPFITLPLVHTIDPDNGSRNLGMYRMQVFDSETTGMHWHMHKTGARHYRGYKAKGQKMPVAVALGGDPIYTYCATAPLPDGIDEYLLAGYIRQKKVKLVRCISQDIWVPDDADIIIEGYVDPTEDLFIEGPFGDHTGFYSLEDYYPRFHVTCITHRKKAVYPSTIVGIPPQEDAWIAVATEKLFLPPIKLSMIPELQDMHMPEPGVAHNLAVFSIEHEYPGQGKKVLSSIWGAGQMMFNKFALVTVADLNIRDYKALVRNACRRVDPNNNLSFAEGPMDVLDHSASKFAFGGKLGFDATGPERLVEFAKHNDLLDKLAPFRNNHPEIVNINTSLLESDIPLAIISFRKNKSLHFKELATELISHLDTTYIPFWIFVDENVNVNDLYQVSWIAGSHIDPGRDALVLSASSQTENYCLLMDATRKTKAFDGFERNWPNPVLMNQGTINKVDKMWDQLNAGKLLPSPSNYYRTLEEAGEAVVNED